RALAPGFETAAEQIGVDPPALAPRRQVRGQRRGKTLRTNLLQLAGPPCRLPERHRIVRHKLPRRGAAAASDRLVNADLTAGRNALQKRPGESGAAFDSRRKEFTRPHGAWPARDSMPCGPS